ncbi:MAG: ankyrin repeat domain-containing protein [Rickettsiaceae bacterium]|nr:ankyrin repeat domain-containing protein [Rickettsiaceae bacterium]
MRKNFEIEESKEDGDHATTEKTPEQIMQLNSELWEEIRKPHYYSLDNIQELIRDGANVNQKKNEGNTPLHIACREGYTDIAELLINHGANVNKENNQGATPLYWACFNGETDLVKLLINHGANVDISILKSIVREEDSVYIDELVQNSGIEGVRENEEVTVHLRDGMGQEILDILHLPQEFEHHIHVIGQNGAEMTLHFAAYQPVLK